MGIIKRGGYFFFTAKGDHRPHHVHIYRDGMIIAKFNLESWVVMTGKINRRIKEILWQLRKERKL